MNALTAKKVTLTVNDENGAQIGKRRTHALYTHALANGDAVISYHTSLAHAQKALARYDATVRVLPVIDPRADWFKSCIVTGSKTETIVSEVPATHVFVEKSTTRRGRYCHNVTLKVYGWFASLEDAESAKATFDGKHGAWAGETEIIEVPVYQNGVRVVTETEAMTTEETPATETTATATETTETETETTATETRLNEINAEIKLLRRRLSFGDTPLWERGFERDLITLELERVALQYPRTRTPYSRLSADEIASCGVIPLVNHLGRFLAHEFCGMNAPYEVRANGVYKREVDATGSYYYSHHCHTRHKSAIEGVLRDAYSLARNTETTATETTEETMTTATETTATETTETTPSTAELLEQIRVWKEAHSAVSNALRACNIKKRNREETIRELRAQNRTLTAQNKSLEDSAHHYREMFEHYAEMADRATERSEERKDRIEELEAQLAEFVSVPADMDLVERAFDQHWRHDGGACMIELTAFEAHRPRDLEIDAYLFNGALYYSDGVGAWSIALEYLLD